MNAQNHPPNETGATQDPGATGISQSQNANPAQPATAQQLEQAETRIDERMSGFERTMIRLTRAGVIIAVITGVIFLGQLYEMISGGTQTDKLIGYASTQATASRNIAGASSDFTDSAFWMEQHMDDAASAIQDSVDTASEDTKTTIRNAQNAFRDEQRAWIGTADPAIVTFEVGKKVLFAVPVKNSGKTPGTVLTVVGAMRPHKIGEIPDFTDMEKPTGRGVLQPGGTTYINIFAENVLDQPSYDAAKSGEVVIWVYGKITYDDVFRRHHWTTFATTFNPSAMGLDTYKTNNEVDKEPN